MLKVEGIIADGRWTELDGQSMDELSSIFDSPDETRKTRTLQAFADASRQVSERQIFGEIGLLDLCIRSFRPTEPEETLKQRLRLIGNCCADNDRNRDIILQADFFKQLDVLMRTSSPLQSIASIVLFNLINDYEPATKYALSNGVVTTLSVMFKSSQATITTASEYGIKILELSLQQETSNDNPIHIPDDLVTSLLAIGCNESLSWDSFQSLLSCLIAIINEDEKKTYLLNTCSLPLCLTIFKRISYWSDKISKNLTTEVEEEDREDALKFLQNNLSSLIAAISDISASDTFAAIYPVGSEFIEQIFLWLQSKDVNMLICAALVLGNIARDTTVCNTLISEYNVYDVLVRNLKEQTQIGVLHAIGGALRNLVLSIPSLKEEAAKMLLIGYFKKFYLVKVMVEVQMMGLGLTRILTAGSLSNIEVLIKPATAQSDISHIKDVLELYEQNTETVIRVEIGRIIASILREISRLSESDSRCTDIKTISLSLYPAFVPPLVNMIIQDKWPVIASEGLFALALMTRSSAGADAVMGAKLPSEFYIVLLNILTTDKSKLTPEENYVQSSHDMTANNNEESESRAQKERSNALIFLSGTLKQKTSDENGRIGDIFQSLLDGKIQNKEDLERVMNLTQPD